MEQKRTLWIVAAAGVFLLVVFFTALIIYSPSWGKTPSQQTSIDPSIGFVTAPADQTPATPAVEAKKEESAVPVYSDASNVIGQAAVPATAYPSAPDFSGNGITSTLPAANIQAQNVTVYTQETTTFDLNALKASSSSNVTAVNQYTANQITASSRTAPVETKSAPAVQENYYTPSPVSKPAAAPKKAEPVKTAAKATTKAPAKTTTAAKVASAAKKPAELYWIQVGAYSSKKNADEARSVLEANKIPVEVFTDSKYFKVRVGPYQTKSEAIYWQKMVSEIGKFADSKTMIVNSAIQK